MGELTSHHPNEFITGPYWVVVEEKELDPFHITRLWISIANRPGEIELDSSMRRLSNWMYYS